MAKLSRVGNSLKEYLVYKPMNGLGNLKPMQKLNKQYQIQNDAVISAVGIASIMLKDGLGCAIYVHNTLKNDKIPDEKRKFLASLDLVKGLFNIVMEVGVFLGFSRVQSKLFNKLFGKYFGRNCAKGMRKVLSKSEKFKDLSSPEYYGAFEKYKSAVSGAFNQITSLIAASIIAKRVIVPFIATPVAGKLQERNERKHQNQQLNDIKTEEFNKKAF